MIVPFVLDGPIIRRAFEMHVHRALAPEPKQGSIVIIDKLSSHTGTSVQSTIDAAGLTIRPPPPHSPDFNPIEQAFIKLKGPLHRAEPTMLSMIGATFQPDRIPF